MSPLTPSGTLVRRKARATCGVASPRKAICHLAPFDLGTLLPVLTHYAGDGGPFVTTGVVLCTDPATGRRGMGIHRMMVKGGTRMGILLAVKTTDAPVSEVRIPHQPAPKQIRGANESEAACAEASASAGPTPVASRA